MNFVAGTASTHQNAIRVRPKARKWRRPVKKPRQLDFVKCLDHGFPKPNRGFKHEGDESCSGCGSTHLVTGHWVTCTSCGLVNGAKLDHRPAFTSWEQDAPERRAKRPSTVMPPLEGSAPRKRPRASSTYSERRQRAIQAFMPIAAFEFAIEIQRAAESTWNRLVRARIQKGARFYLPLMEAAVVIYREHIIRGYPVSLVGISNAVNHAAHRTQLDARYQRVFKARYIDVETTAGFRKLTTKGRKVLADLNATKNKNVVLFDAFCECASLAKGMVCCQYGAEPWARDGALQQRPAALDEAMQHIDAIFALARQQWRKWGAHSHRFMPESDTRSTNKRVDHMEDRIATYRRAKRLMREGAFSVPFAEGLPLAPIHRRVAAGTTHTDAGKFLANCSYLEARERIRRGETKRTNFGVTVVPPSNPRAAAVIVAWTVMHHMRVGLCKCQQRRAGVATEPEMKDLIKLHGVTKNIVVHAEIQLRLAIRGTLGITPLVSHRRPCRCQF